MIARDTENDIGRTEIELISSYIHGEHINEKMRGILDPKTQHQILKQHFIPGDDLLTGNELRGIDLW